MNPPSPLQALLQHFRQSAANPRDLGDRFERLIVAYLKTDPLHATRFSDVWLFNEWPQKGNVGDVGIDIVAREAATGDFCGIQCKFYLPDHTISKDDIDSFISALGRPLFTSGIVVSTTDRWGSNAEHTLGNQTCGTPSTGPNTRESV